MVLCGYCQLACGQDATQAAPQPPADEAALIAVIQSDAGWLEKQTACRALRLKGTAKAIPALAALLPDKELSHMARFALETMPFPEVDQALRDAVGKTEGLPRMGVVISIGVRRDPQAVALIAPLMKDPDADTVRATAGALGRIATPEAVQALRDCRSAAPEPVRGAVAEGLLAAGLRLVQEGKGASAAPIYQDLMTTEWPENIRTGAFHGLASAEPDKAPQRMIEALGGTDPVLRGTAAQVVAETSGEATTKVYADALSSLPVEGQVALLWGLAGRRDVTAHPSVVQALQSADGSVKLAAVKTLGILGSANDVPTLAGLLAWEDKALSAAANASLLNLQGKDVNPAIAAAVADSPPVAYAQLLDLLVSRRGEQALPLAIEALGNGDMAIRIAGLRTLNLVGTKEQIPVALTVLAKASEASERSAAEKALGSMGLQGGEDTIPLFLDAMQDASLDSRIVLLHVLARVGGPKALATVLAGVDDKEPKISDESVRLLCDWSSLDAAPHLLGLAESEDLTRQVLALRGYVRLAGIEPSPEAKATMLTTAMTLAKRPEEKKPILGAWGKITTQQSLDTLLPYLDDAAVQNEAALAIVPVATDLAKIEAAKPKAVDALKAVVEKCADPGIKEKAQGVLAGIQ